MWCVCVRCEYQRRFDYRRSNGAQGEGYEEGYVRYFPYGIRERSRKWDEIEIGLLILADLIIQVNHCPPLCHGVEKRKQAGVEL